jgi:hypothetical protein
VKLKEKLAKEKSLAGKTYILPKFNVDPLLKNRSELMKDKPAEGAGAAPTAPAAPPMPIPSAPAAHSAPTSAKHEPVTATTPPISVDIPAAKPEADKADKK